MGRAVEQRPFADADQIVGAGEDLRIGADGHFDEVEALPVPGVMVDTRG